jgi:hypothetical protein
MGLLFESLQEYIRIAANISMIILGNVFIFNKDDVDNKQIELII